MKTWFTSILSSFNIVGNVKTIVVVIGVILALITSILYYHNKGIDDATKELKNMNAELRLHNMENESTISTLGGYINSYEKEITTLKSKINSLEYNLTVKSVDADADSVYGKYEDCKGTKYDYTKFDIINFSY